MSTSYFILTKPNKQDAQNNSDNQIVDLGGGHRQVYLLPRNNINYYIDHGLFESQLIDWCKQFCKKDGIFLDVGAHTGTYSISLAPFTKEVYAFEPQRMTYYSLCGGIALSNYTNIYAHNYGLGSLDQIGEQTLNIVSNDGGGSSIHVNNPGSVLRTEKIHIRTLDTLGIENICFIKMDVEDNELFVLKGGKETLRKSNWPAMIFESNRENIELFEYIIKETPYKIIPISGVANMFLAAV